jgi:hypothetical protein
MLPGNDAASAAHHVSSSLQPTEAVPGSSPATLESAVMISGESPGRTYDPKAMALRGRIGAHVTHSRHDPRYLTAAEHETFLAKFERQVDPNGVLSDAERLRRAPHARQAYFTRLALRSAAVRRKAAVSAKETTRAVA